MIAVLCAVIIILLAPRSCGAGAEQAKKTVTTSTKYIGASKRPFIIRETVKVPQYISVPQLPSAPEKIDTAAIISSHYSKVFYRDSLVRDSVELVIEDTLYQNRIHSRVKKIRNLRPTYVITQTTVNHPPSKSALLVLYMGAHVGYSPRTKQPALAPFAAITLRQGAMIGYSYEAFGNTHQLQFGWKISFKKPVLSGLRP